MVIRRTNSTRLIVGEGPAELLLLSRLKELYLTRESGISVSIKNGQGGCPEHIVDRAIRLAANAAYDHKFAFMDTDIPWTQDLEKKARKKHIKLLGSEPCIEGLLLRILGINVPDNTNDCKARFFQHHGFEAHDNKCRMLITPELLNNELQNIELLRNLHKIMTEINLE